MSLKHEDEQGNEIEVYTNDEVAAQIATVKAENESILKAKEDELVNLRKVSAEKTENFRKYNEMTEEERKAHSENEIIQIRRADQLADELGKVRLSLEDKEKKERDYAKTSALKNFHGDKEDIKNILEEKYSILAGMPETNPQEIQARVSEAAKLAGIVVNSVNPLYSPFNGEAPQYKEKKDYTESGSGKEATDLLRAAMGLNVDNK